MGPVRVQPSTSHHSLDCFVIQQQLSSRIETNNFVFVDIFVGDVTRDVHRGQRSSNKGKKEWKTDIVLLTASTLLICDVTQIQCPLCLLVKLAEGHTGLQLWGRQRLSRSMKAAYAQGE